MFACILFTPRFDLAPRSCSGADGRRSATDSVQFDISKPQIKLAARSFVRLHERDSALIVGRWDTNSPMLTSVIRFVQFLSNHSKQDIGLVRRYSQRTSARRQLTRNGPSLPAVR